MRRHCDADAARTLLSRIEGMTWDVEEVTPSDELCERFARKYDFFRSIYGAPGELATFLNSGSMLVRELDDERCARLMQPSRPAAQNGAAAASAAAPESPLSGACADSVVVAQVREIAASAAERPHNEDVHAARDLSSHESTLTPLLRAQRETHQENENALLSHVSTSPSSPSGYIHELKSPPRGATESPPRGVEIPWADEVDEHEEYLVKLDLLHGTNPDPVSSLRGKSPPMRSARHKYTPTSNESEQNTFSMREMTSFRPSSSSDTMIPSVAVSPDQDSSLQALPRLGSNVSHQVNIKWKDVKWRPTLVFHGTDGRNVRSIGKFFLVGEHREEERKRIFLIVAFFRLTTK